MMTLLIGIPTGPPGKEHPPRLVAGVASTSTTKLAFVLHVALLVSAAATCGNPDGAVKVDSF